MSLHVYRPPAMRSALQSMTHPGNAIVKFNLHMLNYSTMLFFFLKRCNYATSIASICTRLASSCLERCGAARSATRGAARLLVWGFLVRLLVWGLFLVLVRFLLVGILMQSTTRTSHRRKKQCLTMSTIAASSVSRRIACRWASRVVQFAILACVLVAVRTASFHLHNNIYNRNA